MNNVLQLPAAKIESMAKFSFTHRHGMAIGFDNEHMDYLNLKVGANMYMEIDVNNRQILFSAPAAASDKNKARKIQAKGRIRIPQVFFKEHWVHKIKSSPCPVSMYEDERGRRIIEMNLPDFSTFGKMEPKRYEPIIPASDPIPSGTIILNTQREREIWADGFTTGVIKGAASCTPKTS